MTRFRGVRRLFRITSVRADVQRDIEEELAYHFERAVDDLQREGLDPLEARLEAERRFGSRRHHSRSLESIGHGRVKMEMRAEWASILRQDLAYAFRGIRKHPGFATAVVVTLALGLGANAMTFGVVDRLLLRAPEHVDDADRVRRLYIRRSPQPGREIITSAVVTEPDYFDWAQAGGLEAIAGYAPRRPVVLGSGPGASRLSGTWATASFFPLLGVQPALGRFFTEDEDRRGAPGVAVLGFGFWQRHFGGDADILGRTITLRDQPFTIVGVAPEGFTGVELRPVEIWLPMWLTAEMTYGSGWVDNRGSYWIRTVVRLRSDIGSVAAEAELTGLHRAGRADYIAQDRYDAEAEIAVAPLLEARGPRASSASVVSRWLAGVAMVVLLIACANVANLLLARGMARRRELGIRVALGISRRRLVGQLLVEALVLALLGGLAALAITQWGAQLMRSLLLPQVQWDSPINPRVVLFMGVAVLATALITGILPAFHALRQDVAGTLKVGGPGGGLQRAGARRVLLVGQAALSVVLLAGAGLFVLSLDRVKSLDLGIEVDKVMVVRPELTRRDRTAAERIAIFESASEVARSIPGIGPTSITGATPFSTSESQYFSVPGIDSLPKPGSGGPYVYGVTADYFDVLGMRLLEGRGFTDADDANGARVTVLSSAMAQDIWPDESALGRCVLVFGADQPCTEVIGIVGDPRREAVVESRQWTYFLPSAQHADLIRPESILLRVEGDLAGLGQAVRREVLARVSDLSFLTVRPLSDSVDPQLASWRLGASMFSVFGLLALAVAGVGLFSVLSFDVARRTREMGIRAALGASHGRIVGMVFRDAAGLVAAGVVLGLVIVLGVGSLLEPLLFQVSPREPVVLIGVALSLMAVGALAGFLPARRASSVDPNVALRTE